MNLQPIFSCDRFEVSASYHGVEQSIVSYRTVLYRIVSYRIVSYRIVSYLFTNQRNSGKDLLCHFPSEILAPVPII